MKLFLLLVSHAICDYPLQGDFLARGKNHKNPIPGIPFYQCLLAHALIQGGGVTIVTGRLDLGLIEFGIHTIIDFCKCQGLFGFNIDQVLHLICKLIWWWLL